MTRHLFAAAVAAIAGVGVAAPVPKTAPPPAPKASALGVQLATAKLSGDNVIQITNTRTQMQAVPVTETVEQNGQQVTVTRYVTQSVEVPYTYQTPLKGMKATTADGKEVGEDDLAKKLADPTAVVQVPFGFDPEWKKLFADDVIFLEPARGGVGVGFGPGGAPGVPQLPKIAPALPGGGGVLVPQPADKRKD